MRCEFVSVVALFSSVSGCRSSDLIFSCSHHREIEEVGICFVHPTPLVASNKMCYLLRRERLLSECLLLDIRTRIELHRGHNLDIKPLTRSIHRFLSWDFRDEGKSWSPPSDTCQFSVSMFHDHVNPTMSDPVWAGPERPIP